MPSTEVAKINMVEHQHERNGCEVAMNSFVANSRTHFYLAAQGDSRETLLQEINVALRDFGLKAVVQ